MRDQSLHSIIMIGILILTIVIHHIYIYIMYTFIMMNDWRDSQVNYDFKITND